MLKEFRSGATSLGVTNDGALLAPFQLRPKLVDEVVKKQLEDRVIKKIWEEMKAQQRADFELRSDGALLKHGRVYVPKDTEVKQAILDEAHSSTNVMHPGSTKMYRALQDFDWWPGMKREIAEFMTKCLICQRIKPEH